MIFKKIDLILPPLDLARVKGEPYEAYGNEFYSFHVKDQEYLDQVLKDRIKFNILPCKVTYDEIPNGTVAHSHATDTATLNYYINSTGATLFFQPRPTQSGIPSPRILPNGETADTSITQYKLSEIKYIDKFVPKSGEAYFFDPSQIHSVARLPNPSLSIRKILRFVWFTGSFQEILDSIEILSTT